MKSYRLIAVVKWPSQNEDVFSRYGEMERGGMSVQSLSIEVTKKKKIQLAFPPLKNKQSGPGFVDWLGTMCDWRINPWER